MSGPALRKVESHQAIHEAGWHEVEDTLLMAERVRNAANYAMFARIVEVFLEIVETRILGHAEEEEHGLYQEWRQNHAQHPSTIDALILEHATLRRLYAAVEHAMIQQTYDIALSRMNQLVQVSAAHSRHEEDMLRSVALAKRGAL